MTRLKDKFTIDDMKEYEKRFNEIHYSITHWKTRNDVTERELELINTIDYLVRVPNIFCRVIEEDIKGHIETGDPHGYAKGKLGVAEASLRHYLELREIDFNID